MKPAGVGTAYRLQYQDEAGTWQDLVPWIKGPTLLEAAKAQKVEWQGEPRPRRVMKGIGGGIWRVIETW